MADDSVTFTRDEVIEWSSLMGEPLRVSAAARRLGVTTAELLKAIDSGHLRAHRHPDLGVAVTVEDLDQFQTEHAG